MNTLTDKDLTILESLDFEPACEKSNHNSGESARWAVVYLPVADCGCPTPGVLLWCEPCKARHLRVRWTYCSQCGHRRPAPWSAIVRFEPLS